MLVSLFFSQTWGKMFSDGNKFTLIKILRTDSYFKRLNDSALKKFLTFLFIL